MSPLQLELHQTLNSIPPKGPICVTVGSEGSSGKSHPEEAGKFLLESLESLKFSGKVLPGNFKVSGKRFSLESLTFF